MDSLDLQRLTLQTPFQDKDVSTVQRKRLKLPRHKQGDKFLKGPIPLELIKLATSLPGKSWHVYAAIWYLAGFNDTPKVKLTQSVLNEFSVDRYAKYRALDHLAKAKLIQCETVNGKNPLVTLLCFQQEDQL